MVKDWPGGMSPESQLALVLVWVIASLLVNVTGWPALTVLVAGANANLAILTPAEDATAIGAGWITILRGPAPTGTVALTVWLDRSTTDRSFDISLVTYAQRLSELTPIQCGIVPTLI